MTVVDYIRFYFDILKDVPILPLAFGIFMMIAIYVFLDRFDKWLRK